MGPKPRGGPGMACSACYYLVISSTHLSNGHFRRVKGVFRGPLCPTAASDSPECAEGALGCSVEDLKALFYCELCDKQYLRHQEFDNHINSYDHAHKQRLKELKHREFARNVASKSWKDQRKQEKAIRRLHQLAQLQQETQRVQGRSYGLRSAVRVVSQQQDRDVDQRDHSPDDKPEPFNRTLRPSATQPRTATLRHQPEDQRQSPYRTPTFSHAESTPITHPASNTDPPAVNSESRLGAYSQLPLPGQGRAGGRLGVSFCFSRRGPRLEPSASVFSDQEEEEREKREQMKERIKGIMEDIDREIGATEEKKHGEGAERKSSANSDTLAIPSARDEEAIENTLVAREHLLVPTAVPGNQAGDSLPSPSQTQVNIWSAPPVAAHTDNEHTDSETERRRETKRGSEGSPYMCVVGKDGATRLRWPVSLLKFTKSRPYISYSCSPLCSNPQQPEHTEDQRESRLNPLCTVSSLYHANSSVPAILTPDAKSCLHTRNEPRAHRRKKAGQDVKAEPHIDAETEAHLFLKNKTLSPSERGTEREQCMLSRENCARAASRPFDPAHSDSSDTNPQNPPGGRLEGAGRISERAVTALSCKLESVTWPGARRIRVSPSRCECGSETPCECAPPPPPYVGISEASRKRRKAGTKKHNKKRREASIERQVVRRKVRSVVSTVARRGEDGAKKERQRSPLRREMRRRRRRTRRTGSSCLLGRCEAEPVSVPVRKRRPHRSHSSEAQSQPDREQAEHCSVYSQLSRHTADRGAEGEGKSDGNAVTFPWRSHFSVHSFSPGYNSKPFWEKGHHSNPRSFIDCSYPDNSCDSSPARKRKLLHRDRKFIHGNRKGSRQTGCGDRQVSDAEPWEWEKGSCHSATEEGRAPRAEWRLRNRAAEWDRASRFSPSPSSRGRRSRNMSVEDVDWDRCSLDRWTWGSSDSWEDRGTHRSVLGSRTADTRESPGCVWRYTGRQSSSRHLSSPEWWTSRQIHSPQSTYNTRGSRGLSPRPCSPCSPCSSTSMSELSWEWSRSSTCSGITDNGTRLSPEAPREAKKQSSPTSTSSVLTSSSLAHSSPRRSSFAPTVQGPDTHQGDSVPSQPDLGHGPSAPGTSPPRQSTGDSAPQKPARTLLLPLIGKLPAIQRKARRKKGLLEKRQEKEGEDEGEAGGSESVVGSQSHPESKSGSTPTRCPSEIRTDDKQTGGEAALPISFTAEEMDKYRLLQEQAREHMQKVLEQTQEGVDTHVETNYAQVESCRTSSEEQYTPTPLHNPPPPHTDTMQTQAQHSLQVSLPLPHVNPPENYTHPVALGVCNLPPLPLSPSLSNLHHIILQHTGLSVPPSSSSSSSTSPPSSTIHPHPPQIPHPLTPLHPSLPHHLHLSPFSISSLFPSILLSHHPIPLLPPSAAFHHATPLAPLSPVALPPLNPQTFMGRAWPVRFQQKAL